MEAARVLHVLLIDYRDIESRVAQLTEIEHQGDLIVHEILDLLSRTFLTPLEDDEIRALTRSLDDVLDHIEAAASALPFIRRSMSIKYLGVTTWWGGLTKSGVW